MTSFWKLSAAGFAATAMTYGPARMGFGLFLPEFRSEFSVSTATAGLISGLGFLGFLLGLLAAYGLTARRGPRLPIILGLRAASAGMSIVALASSLPMLSIGVFLAMSSSGFSWAPFNNAVNRQVRDELRPAALSIVNTEPRGRGGGGDGARPEPRRHLVADRLGGVRDRQRDRSAGELGGPARRCR